MQILMNIYLSCPDFSSILQPLSIIHHAPDLPKPSILPHTGSVEHARSWYCPLLRLSHDSVDAPDVSLLAWKANTLTVASIHHLFRGLCDL